MQWLCERLNRSYSNSWVWSAHKGRVLESWHIKQVEAWGPEQCAQCPSSFTGLPVASHYHTPSANFYTKSRNHSAPENSSGMTDGQMCLWESLCPLSFSAFGNPPGTTAVTSCVAEDDWIYPVEGVHCRPGAAVESFSGLNLSLNPRVVSRLLPGGDSAFPCTSRGVEVKMEVSSLQVFHVKGKVWHVERVRWTLSVMWGKAGLLNKHL